MAFDLIIGPSTVQIGQSMTHEIKGSIKWGPMLDTIGTDQSDLVVSSFVLASRKIIPSSPFS